MGEGDYGGAHRGGEPGGVEPVSFDSSQTLPCVEVALDTEHSALPQYADAGQIEGADMVKRPGYQQSRIAIYSERQDMIGRLPVKIFVTKHHTLWPVRRARRVHQSHQVGWQTVPRRSRFGIPQALGFCLRVFIP